MFEATIAILESHLSDEGCQEELEEAIEILQSVETKTTMYEKAGYDILKGDDGIVMAIKIEEPEDKVTNKPLIDFSKDRIFKEIEHESMNLTSVIFEIIQRCLINYKDLPKAEDVCGIFKEESDSVR